MAAKNELEKQTNCSTDQNNPQAIWMILVGEEVIHTAAHGHSNTHTYSLSRSPAGHEGENIMRKVDYLKTSRVRWRKWPGTVNFLRLKRWAEGRAVPAGVCPPGNSELRPGVWLHTGNSLKHSGLWHSNVSWQATSFSLTLLSEEERGGGARRGRRALTLSLCCVLKLNYI